MSKGVQVPHSRPFVGEEEVAAVAAVVRSRQLSQGPKVRELESRWCRATGTEHAAAVGSGLGALRLALLALGVGPGDEVILPAYSCLALLNATLALGAAPVLADVDFETWTLSVEDTGRRLTPQTKAIVAVHLFGFPAPVERLTALGPPVVEDCAHGIGGLCGRAPFGGAGALSVASFYATKMLAGGEGGIVAGGDEALLERVRRARAYADQPADGRHLNDKMTDLEAALILAQLDRLKEILGRRAERARGYRRLLAPLVERGWLALPRDVPGRIWYRYVVRLTRHSAACVAADLAARGVHAEQPVHDLRGEPAFGPDLRVSAVAFDRLLSLPLYPDLSEDEQQVVGMLLAACLEREPRLAERNAHE